MTDPTPKARPEPHQTGASLPLRVIDLPARHARAFHLRPDAATRTAIAGELGLSALRKLDFRGTVQAEGRHDWRLDATLGATIVQPCVVTAEPVTTRIDTTVTRRFLRKMPEPQGAEAEIPEDDTLEPLGEVIDPGAVMVESLALALPDYPRAPGAELGAQAFPPQGADPLDTDRPNPFAVLSALKHGEQGED